MIWVWVALRLKIKKGKFPCLLIPPHRPPDREEEVWGRDAVSTNDSLEPRASAATAYDEIPPPGIRIGSR